MAPELAGGSRSNQWLSQASEGLQLLFEGRKNSKSYLNPVEFECAKAIRTMAFFVFFYLKSLKRFNEIHLRHAFIFPCNYVD